MAARKPALWAFLILSSKAHSPLTIKANLPLSLNSKRLRSGEQASRGFATCNDPHTLEPLRLRAKKTKNHSKFD